MDDTALVVSNVTKRFKDFTLNNISFSLPKGCIMGIVGNNGAGKTTLLKCILDLVNIDSGEIRIFGNDSTVESSRKDVGMVFDEEMFPEDFTPKQLSRSVSVLYETWDDGLYMEMCQRFEIPQKRMKHLSKGMKVKLQIALALAHRPKLLIMDEPAAGLDPAAREDLYDLFAEFVSDGERSVVISTHITDDLDKVADYVLFLKEGETVFFSDKDSVIDEYGIIRCTREDYARLDKEHVLSHRTGDYGMSVLISDKKGYREAYPELTVDDARLSDIIIITLRGE